MLSGNLQRLGKCEAEEMARHFGYTLSDELYKIVFCTDHHYFRAGPTKHGLDFSYIQFFVTCHTIELLCLAYPDVKAKLHELATGDLKPFAADYEKEKKKNRDFYSPLLHLHHILKNDKCLSISEINPPDDLEKYSTSLSDQAFFMQKVLQIMLYGCFEMSHAAAVKNYLDKLNKDDSLTNPSVMIMSRKMVAELHDTAINQPTHHFPNLVEAEIEFKPFTQNSIIYHFAEAYLTTKHTLLNYLLNVHLHKKVPMDGAVKEKINFIGMKETIIHPLYKSIQWIYDKSKWDLNIAKIYQYENTHVSLAAIIKNIDLICNQKDNGKMKSNREDTLNRIKHDLKNDYSIGNLLTTLFNQAAKTMLYAAPRYISEDVRECATATCQELNNQEASAYMATLGLPSESTLETVQQKYIALVSSSDADVIIKASQAYAALWEHFNAKPTIEKKMVKSVDKATEKAEQEAEELLRSASTFRP